MNGYYDDRPGLGGSISPAVKVIVIANVAVFLLQFLTDLAGPATKNAFYTLFTLNPVFLHGYLWQPFTYMFLHGGMMHIFFNMLMLFFLGPETERTIGTRRFVILYLLCGIFAGLGWVVISMIGSHDFPACLGASGAVYGVLGAFAGLYPNRRITLLLFFVLPITLTARMLAFGTVVISFFFLADASGGGVAHAAHLSGVIIGYVYGVRVAKKMFYGWDPLRAEVGFVDKIRTAMAKRRMRVITDDGSPSEDEVNAVLDRMLDGGFDGLSQRDRDILDRASKSKRGL